ncbi:relaxase/mobilization nuclease domain-containing protein [Listeria monocytogenes]|nr:relaxase [Listeria monocytogenes]EEP2907171.1 relaxase/mobilization nuclease domain-containing protein [Listeria monocytogenes]EEP2907595.1 relaxase/mobilization nuclease domain-containing protein [Listeria monocytogenes]EEP6699449.1 relaxase/mobilization nuclease domain-containing protein [Listeria monocytogenes]EEP6699765.1 relaxase/mobilization nuclease domain-containing protein [Listeria monocytogenes]
MAALFSCSKGGVIIATTRLISMHQNKGKSIADCLADRTDYAKNPDKTNDGELLSSYECDPKTVQAEFMLSKRQYDDITGRKQASNVIAYQIRQAFKPREITPELANKIGYELGMSFTKGNHAFIVATHTDKAHIHNHIIFNSTTLDCTKKFRDFLGSGRAIAKISDRICLENGLSIIENPKRSKGHYGKWLGDKKPLSHSDKLRQTIDEVLAKKPTTFDGFLQLMQGAGYEIKSGKHYAFKGAEQKKFIRLRSLGEEYSEDEIKAIIEGKSLQREVKKSSAKQPKQQEKSVNLLVDIQAKLQQGKGKGYERWAKIFNLKQMAQTVNFLQERKLLAYSDLEEKAKKCTATFDELNTQIKTAENRMAEIQVLKNHIINYAKTRDIYTAYRKAGYSQKFYEEHRSDLTLHKAAKAAFDELTVKKLPTVKTLQSEYADLLSQKKKAYGQYHAAKKEMQDILTAKANIDRLLGLEQEQKAKEKSQEQR